MGIWFVIVAIWAAFAAAGAIPVVSVPWLVTISCWAGIDVAWNWLARRLTPADAGRGAPIRKAPVRSRVLTMVPYLLYCLPLDHVPILGLRLFPPLLSVQWAGAAICLAGAAFGIYARCVLAKSWSGDVAITPVHALVQRGPYAVVRHPIYLGFLVAQLGMIVALGQVRALIFVYGIERLLKKLPLEEAALRMQYPAEYEQYARRVWKLIPLVW